MAPTKNNRVAHPNCSMNPQHLLHRHIALHGKSALQKPVLHEHNIDQRSWQTLQVVTPNSPRQKSASFNSPSINLISFLREVHKVQPWAMDVVENKCLSFGQENVQTIPKKLNMLSLSIMQNGSNPPFQKLSCFWLPFRLFAARPLAVLLEVRQKNRVRPHRRSATGYVIFSPCQKNYI